MSSIPAYVYYELNTNTMPVAAGGQTIYVKFIFSGGTWNWSGTGARGAHLDGIYLSTPPPAAALPFSEYFETAGDFTTKWEVTNQLWPANNWINRVSLQPGTYAAISGTRVAGYSYQPASLDTSTPNFGTTSTLRRWTCMPDRRGRHLVDLLLRGRLCRAWLG